MVPFPGALTYTGPMPTCTSCSASNADDSQFCAKCGSPLEASTAGPREIRKTVTVVFTDVTGSTAMGERLDPESLRRVMSRYFVTMREVLERHGGTVEKFIGDAIVAVFGVPSLHEDDALRAVRAAAEMRAALATLNEELVADWGVTIAVRTGVNSGEVVAGDPVAGEALVIGDAVNVAARLEQAAAPGEILLGAATHRLVRNAVVVEPVEQLLLKGKGEPTSAVRLVQVLEGVESFARRLDSPMVGRDRQLDALRRAFEGVAADNACHLFTILGTAGVGKSRLVEEFVKDLGGRAEVLRGRCLSYGQGITFWPVAEIVKGAAGLQDFDESEAVERKIVDRLAGDEYASAIANRLAQVIGVTSGSAPPEEAQWAVRRLLEILGAGNPVVVVFDDIHWAEPALLDLIDHVADSARDASIVLLCTARPEFLDTRAGWAGGKMNATSILLEPLSDAQSESLISNLLGATDLAEDVRARIVHAAEGNPLFVEQMLAMLIDDGLVRSVDGQWVATSDRLEVSVPPTIAALLSARLDRLDSEERDVIGRASVVGKVFYRGALLELSAESMGVRIDALLQALVRKDLIRPDRSTLPGEDAFRFRHILVLESAYGALPKDLRATLHERCADWLERAAGDHAEEQGEIIGYHLEQAFRYRQELGAVTDEHRAIAHRAAARLSSGGIRSFARSDFPSAINLLSRATALLPGDDPARIALLPDLASALEVAGRGGEADPVWAEAVDGARTLSDDRLLAHALVMRWRWRLAHAEEVEEASRDADWAMGIFEAAGDDRGLARAWLLRGHIAWQWKRQAAGEEEAVEHALEFARRAGDAYEEYGCFGALARTVVRGPTPAQAGIDRCTELLLRYNDQRAIEAHMCHALAHLHARLGAFEQARAFATRCRAFYRDTGQEGEFAFWGEIHGDIEMLAGDPAAAERFLREGYEGLDALGERNAALAALLARSICMQERWDDAEPYATLAASEAGSVFGPMGKGSLARVRAHQGRVDEAEVLAREAVALLEGTDFLTDRADVLTDAADVFVVAGRADEAADALALALTLYEQKGDIVTPPRIQAMLDGIRPTEEVH
jgi:class 3 adenylate cyclase/tetratricopeptide (TPR) repeat protein